MKHTWVFAALSLAACVNGSDPVQLPRYYVNYKAFLVEQFDHAFMGGPYATVPGPVRFGFESCGADATLAQYTDAERAKLDAFARREITLSADDLRQINAGSRAKFSRGMNLDRMYQEMEPFCPDQIPVFKQYFR